MCSCVSHAVSSSGHLCTEELRPRGPGGISFFCFSSTGSLSFTLAAPEVHKEYLHKSGINSSIVPLTLLLLTLESCQIPASDLELQNLRPIVHRW